MLSADNVSVKTENAGPPNVPKNKLAVYGETPEILMLLNFYFYVLAKCCPAVYYSIYCYRLYNKILCTFAP